MSIWASMGDVEAVYEADVPQRAQALLDQAETLLKAKVAGIADRIALDTDDASYLDPALVTLVLTNAVIRVLRNPQGLSWEREGEYSYGLPIGVKGDATGGVWFLEEELNLLTLNTGIAKIGTIGLTDPWKAPRPRHFPRLAGVWSDDPNRVRP